MKRVKIRTIEAIALNIGFKETFSFGNTDRKRSPNVIVKITSEDGVIGYGEACPVSAFTQETQQSIIAAVNEVSEFLIGQDVLDRSALICRLEPKLMDAPFARCAVDLALWDLAGRALDLPVWKLLGGRHRDQIIVHGSIGMGTAEAMVENAQRQIAQGFTSLKLYAGRDRLTDDLQRLGAVRDAIGPGIDFLLDVNGLWDVETCLDALPKLADLGVTALEQPLAPDDVQGLARVTEAGTIPIIADESVFMSQDVARIGSEQTADGINLGLSKLGGLTRANDCATVARVVGLDVMVGSVLELDLATAAGLQLASTLPDLPYPSYLIGPLKYEQQLAREPITVTDSVVNVPDGPGLGVEVDQDLLDSLAM